MPSAAAGAVTATELQQSIFNAPPSASNAVAAAPGTLKPPAGDQTMADARSPATSVAGQKRRRDEEEAEEDSEGDVAMEEDSDDEE
jgi:U2 small nuclear ribonucleoprotein B''